MAKLVSLCQIQEPLVMYLGHCKTTKWHSVKPHVPMKITTNCSIISTPTPFLIIFGAPKSTFSHRWGDSFFLDAHPLPFRGFTGAAVWKGGSSGLDTWDGIGSKKAHVFHWNTRDPMEVYQLYLAVHEFMEFKWWIWRIWHWDVIGGTHCLRDPKIGWNRRIFLGAPQTATSRCKNQ